MKKSKKHDWYNLAQILAILSGSLFIIAGFFINAFADYQSSMQVNNGLIYQAKSIEPNALPYLRDSNKILGEMALSAYKYFNLSFYAGVVVSLGTLIAWFMGYKSK